MKRIATIVGARPQFIKAAVVSRALRRRGAPGEDLIHTGQHYDTRMSEVFFAELDIPPPRVNLGIGSGSHAVQTARMLAAIETALLELDPGIVLLYGDTNSTVAGALAAAKLNIPVAHVEAGLRSFARSMPEEINRIVADHVSSLLFPPTAGAEERLIIEGLGDRHVRRVGDVMYDAVIHARGLAASRATDLLPPGLPMDRYILATIHRAENTDSPERLGNILAGLTAVSETCPVILPLHPRTRAAMNELPAGVRHRAGGMHLIDPVGYLAMQRLEAGARLIVTDSGGVQKEAYWHGVPCVTLRGETEWTELVEVGWNQLAPPTSAPVVRSAVEGALGRARGPRPDLYGDGTAGERIADELASFLKQ